MLRHRRLQLVRHSRRLVVNHSVSSSEPADQASDAIRQHEIINSSLDL